MNTTQILTLVAGIMIGYAIRGLINSPKEEPKQKEDKDPTPYLDR